MWREESVVRRQSLAESVSEGLVREYLFRHKLTDTMAAFERERPRVEKSITNCNVLRKHLGVGVEKVAAKAKKLSPDESLPPTIELTVRYLLAKAAGSQPTAVGNDSVQVPKLKSDSVLPSPSVLTSLPQHRTHISRASTTIATVRPATSPHTHKVYENNSEVSFQTVQSSSIAVSSFKNYGGDTEVVDIEDFEDELEAQLHSTDLNRDARGASARSLTTLSQASSSIGGQTPGYCGKVVKLSTSDGALLKELLFAKQGGRQPASWVQGFFFSEHPGLEYGLVQREGGPCGVLAAVQAHVLTHLIGKSGGHPSYITREQQQNSLCKGLSSAIWQARGNKSSVSVVRCAGKGGLGNTTVGLGFDDLLRSATVETAVSKEDVERLVAHNLSQWEEPRGQGLCMFILSVLISHGIAETREDMDEAGSGLVGAHGSVEKSHALAPTRWYCTQDLVNLLIIGRAHSNVFNHEMALDEQTRLRGIPAQSSIGFLTLFEWYKNVEVGSYYKHPTYPIWVICCESHFSCIFAEDGRAAARGMLPTNLHYYDGLANQDAPIKLTLKAGDSSAARRDEENDLVPPLEYVLRTRWREVAVDWNDTEPLL